jgi:hypothetical protein
LAGNRHELASQMERSDFRIASMTVQSSFLIRCLLGPSGESTPGKTYFIQHVQTAAEFRAAVTQWVAAQNLRYIADAINASSDSDSGVQEDL